MAELKNLPHIKYDYVKPDYFSVDPMKPLIEEMVGELRIQEENHIMKAVADVGISVDKPRLLQALTDAKAFYEEGYRAAMNRADVVEVVRCKDCKYFIPDKYLDHTKYPNDLEADGLCGNIDKYKDEDCFCSSGAKMDGEGEGE